MTPYAAPLEDMRFVLEHLIGLDALQRLPGCEEATPDMVEAILEEASKLATATLDPINAVGDRQHAQLVSEGVVRMPDGFKEAYDAYRDGGWNAVPFDPEYGGQGLPWSIAFAIQEMWQASNMSFGLCPMLNQGAVELLQEHGSEHQKRTFLPNLISGVWTGTMNLTEPQSGSDLSTVRTLATSAEDGTYRIKGQKIYITFGEHDLADNIIHLVLARTPDAPEGTRGISLFLVPKFMVNEDGTPGERNDVTCVSLESKMGINASPTCTMAYGEATEGAVGYLIGNEREGLKLMFTMMNNARLAVGLQGIAVASRAFGQALAYARDRVQGRSLDGTAAGSVRIIDHPDVRRMLLAMKAETEAGRALTYHAAYCLDVAKRHPDPNERAKAQAYVDLFTPVVKAWGTDLGCEVASLGVQVHGGMGYVEESGASQLYRDARIAPIYEGTNGIQANDLVFRKVQRDGGAAAAAFVEDVRAVAVRLEASNDERLRSIQPLLSEAADALADATAWVVGHDGEPRSVAAAAYGYLDLFAAVAGGWATSRAALAAVSSDDLRPAFIEGKVAAARYFADFRLTQAKGFLQALLRGPEAVVAVSEDAL